MGDLVRDELRTERLLLRAPGPADVPEVVVAMADPLIRRFLPDTPDPYRVADAEDWINRQVPAWQAAGGACLLVTDGRTGALLGGTNLAARPGGQAEITYWVAAPARGRGVAAEAVSSVSGWALDRGMARLELVTALDNPAAQRVALAAGYRREGIKRGAGSRADGSRYDQVLWARLDTDPPGPTPRLLPDLPGGELSDGVVALHPLGPDDAGDTYAAWSLPEIARESVPPGAPRRDDVAALCAQAASHWLAGATARLTIRDAPTDTYAGEISLRYTEPPMLTGMVGYHLLPRWRGRGFATRAVRLLSDWALRTVGLARLVAGVSVTNTASQGVLERAGFRKVGLERSCRPGPDGRVDDLLYELIADA